MKTRTALLIALDQFQNAEPLAGARRDVVDLAEALLNRGVAAEDVVIAAHPPLAEHVLPGVRRIDATTAGICAELERMAATHDPDAPAMVHVSSRGTTTADGPAILTADGQLAVDELTTPFGGAHVRSVLFTIDAGFGGGSADTRTWGDPSRPYAWTPSDPTMLAGGTSGPVHEAILGGEVRGVFTWTFCNLLRQIPAGAEWSLADVQHALRVAQHGLSVPQAPVFLPATDAALDLGALADGSEAHVPWRGVQAVYQAFPSHIVGPPWGYESDAPGTLERFLVNTAPALPANQFSNQTAPGANPAPDPNALRFENNGFGTNGSSTPPTVGPNDRAYQVTVDFGWPGDVWMIARGGKVDTTAVEWFINVPGVAFLAMNPGTITFTELPIPTTWDNQTWYSVLNNRQ